MDPLTPKEIGQWQQLEKVRLEKTKRRDDNKNEKKNIREQLDAHSLQPVYITNLMITSS